MRNENMKQLTDLDWTALGKELRQNSLDAHREVVDVNFAYGFLLCNPDCFLGDDASWPKGMPQEPNIELIAAYYDDGGQKDQKVMMHREELLDMLHDEVASMSDALLKRLIDAAEVINEIATVTCEADAVENDLIVKAEAK